MCASGSNRSRLVYCSVQLKCVASSDCVAEANLDILYHLHCDVVKHSTEYADTNSRLIDVSKIC